MKQTDTVFPVQYGAVNNSRNTNKCKVCTQLLHVSTLLSPRLQEADINFFNTAIKSATINIRTYVVVPTEQNCTGFGHNCVHKFNTMPVKQ
jgi:hypothetical protein